MAALNGRPLAVLAHAALVAMTLSAVTSAPPAVAAEPPSALPALSHPGFTGQETIVRYQAPVAGTPLRSFDGPTGRFGAGHRGIDLSAAPGAAVHAAAAGRVTHAGAVAGTTWVTITHDDGVVTTYGPLTDLAVAIGAGVERGAPLGALAAGGHGPDGRDSGLHWGARIGGLYVDPLRLLDHGVPRPSLIGAGGWAGSAHVVVPYAPWPGAEGGWVTPSSPVADRAGFAVPPSPNHLVMVAGLASSSDVVPLDAGDLGYDPRSVTAFSYAGRSGTVPSNDDPHRDQLPYGPMDTWWGVDDAARRLQEQLRAQAAREPGRAVDLVGHSMGGLVILRYLTEYHDPYDRSLPPVANVVTIAAPLQGSDVAELATGLNTNVYARGVLEGGRAVVGGLLGGRAATVSLDAPVIEELRPTSKITRRLAEAWENALHDGPAGALATGTRVLTIGASRDLVVGPHRTSLPRDQRVAIQRLIDDGSATDGAPDPSGRPLVLPLPASEDLPQLEHRILPGSHTGVLETEAVREVTWRFLAGEEVVEAPGRLAVQVSEEIGMAMSVTGLWVRLRETVWQPFRHVLWPPKTAE